MKFFIILMAILAITHAEFTAEDDEKWLQFKLQFKKLFLSPGKEQARKETFLKTAREIEAHNEKFLRGEVSYSQKINKYSDMTEEQFMQSMTGIKLPPELEGQL